jgi:glycerophosphoryl diester phosphodiesterase
VAQRRDQAARSERDTAATHGISFARQLLSARLQFLAYRIKDLPSAAPLFARHILGLPLLTWTVRTPEDRARAARWADQMIFEGFRP